MYYLKMPTSTIIKNLILIHRLFTFDFFGERTRGEEDEYFNEKMPILIPTKYSKLCQYHQFERWIKDKTDFYKYQYLYFLFNVFELKIIIVRILGDQIRIHQKFFKRELPFKAHIEFIISHLKNMLQSLHINNDTDYELAVVFGQNIVKVLNSSVFPTYLNLVKNDFKISFN